MMHCLYRSDFGPADPGFDASAAAQALGKSFPGYTNLLGSAQNPRQLEALLHRLDHGDSASWCETGYVQGLRPMEADGFAAAVAFILLPVAFWCSALWVRRHVLGLDRRATVARPGRRTRYLGTGAAIMRYPGARP